MVCPYPLWHMGAWTIALQQWQGRDLVVFLDQADAPGITTAVARHGATRLNAIPAVWGRILASAPGTGAVPALALVAVRGHRDLGHTARAARDHRARRATSPYPRLLRVDRSGQRGLTGPCRHPP